VRKATGEERATHFYHGCPVCGSGNYGAGDEQFSATYMECRFTCRNCGAVTLERWIMTGFHIMEEGA